MQSGYFESTAFSVDKKQSTMDMSAYLTAPLRLDKICRACLTEKGDMRPLFGACLDEMLVSFASIQVKSVTVIVVF